MTPNLFFHYFFNVDPPHTATGHMPAEYWWIDLIRIVVRVLVGLFAILLVVPPLVWWERRLLGFMQQRQGPNRVGPWGLLQTIADGVKLLLKEDMNPSSVDVVLFVLAPVVFLVPALVTSAVLPWGPSLTWGASAPNVSVGVLYLLAWGSLAVYGVVLAGWSSNNKYSLLGGLRSSAQMISYELGMGLAIVTIVLLTGSLSLTDVVARQGFTEYGLPLWNTLKFFPMGLVAMVIYAICMLAETNRAPFDLPEAETELVAGYHTEYTSMKFAIFFMAEYANMIVVSGICATLFFGGYHAPLLWLDGSYLGPLVALKTNALLGGVVSALVPVIWLVAKVLCGLYFFIWIRATMPRLRYDMLMRAGWLGVFPIALGNILMVAIAMALGYLYGLIGWIVLAVVSLWAFAGSKPGRSFTTNSRRDTTVLLYSEAQPFRGVPEHSGHGDQTLPPNALSEGALAAAGQGPLDDAFAAKKG
ncbi:MAG: NADH-quinone oxidoreductase subunit [Capsulimonas sp.]|jgi:NADH-quinone oxidoreductase subunit H|nr:NADH-quinone oxidoreductase subunit [Capsulimonas sp.]